MINTFVSRIITPSVKELRPLNRHVNLRAIVVASARISTLKWVSDFTSQEPLLCYNSVYTSLALLLDWYVSH